ncbi:hypothetical protein CPAV1605_302 [seawater metagenome]|uniref:Uncharacterized protein n=1 Tax=seawater metagenome TaxID=1561972 RepID=A0A5E8CHQ0_9ZZZZ
MVNINKYKVIKGGSSEIQLANPFIKIGTNTFTLTGKLIDPSQPGRFIIVIDSENEANEHIQFLVYKSNSEVGIWRYMALTYDNAKIQTVLIDPSFYEKDAESIKNIILDESVPLRNDAEELIPPHIKHVIIYKGDNYVTTTFLSIELQKFITESHHILPEYEFRIGDILQGLAWNTPQNLEFIFNTDRKYDNTTNPSFEIANKLEICGNIGLNIKLLYAILKKFYRDVNGKSFYKLNSIIIAHEEIKLQILTYWKEHIFPSIISRYLALSQPEKYDAYEHIFTAISDSSNEPTFIVASMYNLFVTTQFSDNFLINLDTSVQLYTNKIVYDNAQIDIVINSCDFNQKESSNTYRLFYYSYTYLNSTSERYNGEYRLPLYVISLNENDSEINRCGVYNKYMNMGAYLCKIMDYKLQAYFLYDQDRTVSVDGQPVYNFVGDLFNNIWPFN